MELIKVEVNKNHEQVVSARELHKGLGLKTRFSQWVNQNFTAFVEGTDFEGVVVTTPYNPNYPNGQQQNIQDYAITVDMAKNLALMSKTQKGAEYRAYFIEVERKWNDPAEVIKRGYEYLKDENYQLKSENRALVSKNELMLPKAAYFDDLVERGTLTNFRDTAKMLGRRQKEFINWLLERKFIYRDGHHTLKPMAAYTNTYFTIKDNKQGYPQTLITANGRSAFNILLNSLSGELEVTK